MSVVLHLDVRRWRRHLAQVVSSTPGIVPVAKGNGYGFGIGRLAREVMDLGLHTLAVGTLPEVDHVPADFRGDIVVLQPWRPGDPLPSDPRVVLTASRPADIAQLAAEGRRRVLVEVLTPMKRHGLTLEELAGLPGLLAGIDLVGWTIHLPMPRASQGMEQVATQLARQALDVSRVPVWFSHLEPQDYETVRASTFADSRLRVGTALWLGDPGSRRTTATVLDVHPVARGERVGYWQRAMPGEGHVVVVSGGTAHGIALEAPTAASSWRQRAVSAAQGSLAAVSLARSPFTIAGAKRWFVEPPHMQSSMLFLPGRVPPPAVGTEVDVELRLTTASLDAIVDE